ncbi:MAG: hypothetical protein ACK4Z8_10545, partial [Novosphingobium sp.]
MPQRTSPDAACLPQRTISSMRAPKPERALLVPTPADSNRKPVFMSAQQRNIAIIAHVDHG